jgi:O-methyltransferase involved in polyketide biosynthesis
VSDEPEISTEVPQAARIWNYLLGGKDNYPVDREMGDQVRRVLPEIDRLAVQSRQFLNRAVAHLAGDAGVRQFLDVGTGLPTADNTHEVAQRVAPASRVVYVDNDPLVLAHARVLLTSSPEGATDYLDADVRDPDTIIELAAATLDFGRPIALMLMGILEFVPDHDEANAIVDRLVGALPSGSFLALYGSTNVVHGARTDEGVRRWNEAPGTTPMTIRTVEQIGRFFRGLELVEPGLVPIVEWRPVHPELVPDPVDGYAAVGRKP